MKNTLKYIFISLLVLSVSNSQDIINEAALKGIDIPHNFLSNISINLNDAPLELALMEISEKSGINLNYNSDMIALDKRVTIRSRSINPIAALLVVLRQSSAKLKITKGGSLMVLPMEEKTGQISGYVQDAKTGEALPGANVWLEGTTYGSATNSEGGFLISNIPPGRYVIISNYIGYGNYKDSITVKSGKKILRLINLKYSGAGESETIVVTAQAKGQLGAINEQLSAKSIKNVVSSDRIQEMPDANAAVSVGRMPGVSILRDGGEGNQVVVRGLSPKYNKITVDGVELAATGSGNRSTDISMISPYSLEGIEVIKAATADHDADFIGGTVNFTIKTAEKGLKYDLIIQDTYNSLRKTFDNYMLIGSISDRFFNNKFGVFIQGNIERKDRGSNQMGASYWMVTHDLDRVNKTNLGNLYLTNNFRVRKRYGGTLTLDYNIPYGNIYFKNFVSVGTTDMSSYFEGYDVRGRGHYYSTTAQQNKLMVMNNSLNYEQRFGVFDVNASFSRSASKNETPEDLSFGFAERSPALPEGITELPPDSIPYYAYNNIDDAYWSDVGDNRSINEETQYIAKADMQVDFALSRQINGTLKMGGKYRSKNRMNDFNATGGTMSLGSGQTVKNAILTAFPWMQETTPLGSTRLPYTLFIDKNFEHGEFIDGRYTLGEVADINLMRDVIKVMRDTKGMSIDTYSDMVMSSITNDYNGDEYLSAGYMMADMNLTSFIKFIPGVRYEHNRTEYTGVRGRSDSGFPERNYPHNDTTTQRINEYWLPMIHLQILPLDWLQLRFAYTKTLSRPDYDLIIPRMDKGRGEIVYNNYLLRPEQSENFDIYAAFSNNYVGLFTAGVFQKNIKDKIFWLDRRVIIDPAEYGFDDKEKGKFIVTQQNMDNLAKVRGLELDWQTNFWYLPAFLKGLVFNINYTHIFSEAKYPRTVIETEYNWTKPPFGLVMHNIDTTYTQRLIDQPDNILNLSLGYDYKKFAFRVSMFYQANIFSGPNFYPELRSSTDDYLRWDISIKQDLPWGGLQLFCNINNLNNAKDVVLNDLKHTPTSIEHYGMTIDFGLRWRLK